jgi:DNA-binding GntR family transcriptional regulator
MRKLTRKSGPKKLGFDRLSDRAYEQLHRGIIEGRFQPGERLIELRISKLLKVGRTPLREAFLRLAAEGLVEGVPGVGFFVKNMTLKDLDELFQIRAALECLSVRLSMQRGFSELSLVVMRESCERLRKALVAGDFRSANNADLEFHRELIGLANSRRLETAIQGSNLQMLAWEYKRSGLMIVQDERDVVSEHLQIIAAMERRDVDEATRLLNSHITLAFQKGIKAAIEQKAVDSVLNTSVPIGDLS